MKKFRLLLGIIAMLCAVVANAQTKKFEATVVDELGEPCIGASVVIKGTTTGVMTNVDGSFAIDVPAGAEVEVSYIGYVTQTISNFSISQITLEEDRQQIDEVVVVGYGVQKKSHLTGSVSTVPMDDIQDLSSSNLASSLSGLVNGLSVSGGDARPGESAQMYIRNADDISGVGGISQGPLYVIDGYIYPNDMTVGGQSGQNLGATVFNNLDPASIESISVLKDASAAVYGSRAANGVILVTTKKGKQGAPQISYGGNVGIATTFKHPKMLNAYQYGKLYNAMAAAKTEVYNDSSFDNLNNLYQADELEAMKNLDYNLIDKYWRTAITHKHSLNLTGATEKVNYFGGISYFSQDGNMGKLDYSRWTFRAGVDAKIGKGLKLGVNVSGDYGTKNQPYMHVGSSGTEDYNRLLARPRYIPEYVEGMPVAAYGISGKQVDPIQNYHFDLLQHGSDYTSEMTSNINIGANIDYDFSHIKPLKGLRASLTYAKSIQQSKNNRFASTYDIYSFENRAGSGKHLYTPTKGYEDAYDAMLDPAYISTITISNCDGTGGQYYRYMDRTDNYQLNFNVNYARDFGKHSVGALFSIERSESESEYMWTSVDNPRSYGTGQFSSKSDESAIDNNFSRFEMGSLSYIGRINYAYDDKYLIEFLLRSDASTKFSPDNYWGTFPSVSAGWVISKENWFANKVNWVDFLKLRASFGMTGRDNVTAWQWAQFYNIEGWRGAIFGTNPAQSSGSHIGIKNEQSAVNEDAHWDKAYKMNIGIDWNVLRNRLGFNIEYYNQWDREILTKFSGTIPSTVGTNSAFINYGKMNSWGVEFTATWRDRVNENFSYHIQLNTGYHDNKVLLMDFDHTASSYQKIQPGGRTDTGLWGMECIGMFRSYPQIEKYFRDNNITKYMGKTQDQVYPGMLIYKDVRGSYDQTTGKYDPTPNGVIDATEDAVQLSKRSNPYGATINFGIDWKGLTLSAQISAAWGGYTLLPAAAIKTTLTQYEYTSLPSFWNPDNMYVYETIKDATGKTLVEQNQKGYYPNLAFSDVNAVNSSFWRITGARASLNRLTLAYSLPKKWMNAIGISSCRINVTGQNLCWLFNPYPDNFMDPMSGSYGKYPSLRKFTLGLNITF